jgi:hypothetical protein
MAPIAGVYRALATGRRAGPNDAVPFPRALHGDGEPLHGHARGNPWARTPDALSARPVLSGGAPYLAVDRQDPRLGSTLANAAACLNYSATFAAA